MHGDVWVCVYEVYMRCMKCVSGSVYGCVCVDEVCMHGCVYEVSVCVGVYA